MTGNLPKWISFYVYLPWSGNEFLADFLPPLISVLKTRKQIKRFFFIRYAEGGYHLRLRLQPTAGAARRGIETELKNTLRNFRKDRNIAASEIRLVNTVYSREEHYFGETAESVYAELINEQTSYLTMQMLVETGESNYSLLLKNAAALYWIFALSAFDEKDFYQSLAESREFAEKNKTGSGKENPLLKSLGQNVLIAVRRASEAVAKVPRLTRAAALIKRLKRRPNGRFAATHAIHLYCNKLGFSMSQEFEIYTLLSGFPGISGKIEK